MLFSSVTKMQLVFKGIFSGEIFNKVEKVFFVVGFFFFNLIRKKKSRTNLFLFPKASCSVGFYVRYSM